MMGRKRYLLPGAGSYPSGHSGGVPLDGANK